MSQAFEMGGEVRSESDVGKVSQARVPFQVEQNGIRHPLKCSRRITQSKRHVVEFVQAVGRDNALSSVEEP